MNKKQIALYYPYSRCVNENTLKRLILLFDEIWFIDPVPKIMRENLMKGSYLVQSIIDDWNVVNEKYSLLSEKGFTKFFDPTKFIRYCDKALTFAFESNIRDDSIWKLFLQWNEGLSPATIKLPDTWAILKERIPPSVFPLLKGSMAPGYLAFVREQAKFAFGGIPNQLVWSDSLPAHLVPELKERIKEAGFVDASPKEIFDLVFRRIYSDSEVSFSLDTGKSISQDRQEYYTFSCTLPYVDGSTLAINQAMLISEHLGAALVTDSDFHHRMLSLMYHRAANLAPNFKDSLPGLKAKIPVTDLLKYTFVSMNVLDLFISEEDLEHLTLDQCLKYKEATSETLQRLRQLLWELTDEVQSNPWDKSLEQDVKQIIDQKVLPEANRVKDQMSEIKQKLFGTLIVTLATITIPSLIATFFPLISPVLALLFGSSAVAGGSIALAAKEVQEAVMAHRRISQNGLSYLIKLPTHK